MMEKRVPAHDDDEQHPMQSAAEAIDEPAGLQTAAADKYNGHHDAVDDAIVEDDIPGADVDDAESIMLSPPPDDLDSTSEVLHEGPEDEIVVGSAKGKSANSNSPKRAPEQGANGEPMDVDQEDHEHATDDEDTKEPEQRPKRKRASMYEDLAEEKMDTSLLDDNTDGFATPIPAAAIANKTLSQLHGVSNTKGVIVGYWRESEAPDADKHAVKGFIDSRDRLRTRIQPVNREGKTVTGKYPLKPGPGGSWVTFHNIVFDDHLVHLDQHQVKEYVKIRAEMTSPGSEQDPKGSDKRAVQQAIQVCQGRGPPPEGALPPLIAYGAVIPEHARISYSRAEKRRRTANASAASATPDSQVAQYPHPVQPARIAPSYQPVQPAPASQQVPDDLPGHRPTKILLGYWKDSAEHEPANKHAVFGILGNNDMFRVKVGRETRDGRPMQSNFPQGAGALWINSHQWEREDYLADLTREEIKEYCRVRQWQIDHGERDVDVPENRRQAILEARRRAAMGVNKTKPNGANAGTGTGTGNQNPNQNQFTDAILTHESPAHETRQAIARRGPAIYPAGSNSRPGSSPQTPGFRAANRSSNGVEGRLERANNLALNAVSRIEASQAKVEERDAQMGSQMHPPNGYSGDQFRESIGRLNNVWSAQEAHRIRTGNEDAKIHMGVKYERKRTGPFAGKLVSQGAIISIDGEDYVEYRVLTKPTFI